MSVFKNSKAFTLVEILVYLGLFVIIIGLTYPIVSDVLFNYIFLKVKVDLKSEIRNILLRIQREVNKSQSLDTLTDWELVLDQKNEKVIIFQTKSVYLDYNSSSLKGWATNLSIGSISLSGSSPDYGVNFFNSSTCFISSSTPVTSIYALSGYAWSPNIGWIKFRNSLSGEPIYGVCLDSNKELRGWVWNDVVGWISFNCVDLNICGGSNYKVVEKNGYLYGYAWNDVIGWIIFDGDRGRVYLAKLNPTPYYIEPLSDIRIKVENFNFTKIGESYKINYSLKGKGGGYESGETAIILPFK